MHSLLTLSHLLGVVLATAGAWSIRFEAKRRSVRAWRLFLPAALVILCSLALLTGLSNRGKGIWLIAFLVGLPAGVGRAFWLRLRSDHAAKLVRLSPVNDGFWVAGAAGLFAAIDVFVTLRNGSASPLVAAGGALCAGYLGGRALLTWLRSRTAVHLDMK